jgi:type I restriction enzyme R subunit
MNEAETRAEHVDPALAAAGWGVVEGSRIRREYPITLGRLEGYGRRAKSQVADYLPIYRNTTLGVIEAKVWDCDRRSHAKNAQTWPKSTSIRVSMRNSKRSSISY